MAYSRIRRAICARESDQPGGRQSRSRASDVHLRTRGVELCTGRVKRPMECNNLVTNEILAGFEGGGNLGGVDALVGSKDVSCSPFAVDKALFVNLEPDSPLYANGHHPLSPLRLSY